MKEPYYQHAGITIYHGDARDILPEIAPVDVVLTDPVWPNAHPDLQGASDPLGLFTAVMRFVPAVTGRLVVHLGCDSDPRFLQGVPAELPFFRACWLEYVRPHYKGRLLYTSDVAYVFGTPPPSRTGAHVIPGRFIQTDAHKLRRQHPCARQMQHVAWLVRWFARGTVLDPFMGTGTTLRAAKDAGLPAIGIDVEERFCEMAANWMAQEVAFSFEEVGAA